MTWDEVDQAEVSVAEALERGAVAAATRCPNLLFGLDGINSQGITLPWLGIFLSPSEVALYWWVGGDTSWNRDTVAGLTTLIGDLRKLAPGARITLEEWDSPSHENFLPAVDAYLEAHAHAAKAAESTRTNTPA
jgi:hypothetical protein